MDLALTVIDGRLRYTQCVSSVQWTSIRTFLNLKDERHTDAERCLDLRIYAVLSCSIAMMTNGPAWLGHASASEIKAEATR